jgi:metal-responsive CopG/Arc/MetJ family transcriptional regulator
MPKSIKLNSDLWQRVEQYARKAGYSSPEEFVEHVLEKELARQEQDDSEKEVERRLKGLGYLD